MTHHLLTVLGKRPREASYTLNGQVAKAALAPLALMSLLPPDRRPSRIVALCTPEARADSLPLLMHGLPKGCELMPVDVPTDHGEDGINAFLVRATAAVSNGDEGSDELSIDVTHGFRHFSFLTYLAGLYLVSLRNAKLIGAWYGLLQEGESPFLDLRPLLELPRWIHALQVLGETGSALPLAEALQTGVKGQNAANIAKDLNLISKGYLSALPLELGRHVQKFLSQRPKAMTSLIRTEHKLPLAQELVARVEQVLRPFSIQDESNGKGWKARVQLTPEELERQSRLINGLFTHGDECMALGLLNEWTVSWALWNLNDTSQWLDFATKRRWAASQLGAIAAACQKPELRALLTPEQKALGDFWHMLTNLRNGFHHHGMRKEEIVGNAKVNEELSRVKAYWEETLQTLPRLSLRIGDDADGALLVTPIGNRPGVLFSALMACREKIGGEPSACLVICSSQSATAIEEAVGHAGYTGEINRLVLEDPHGGLREFAGLRTQAQEACIRASEVLVNVTGGTTLMGLAAQDIEGQARSFARTVHRFGLIDRRPPAEQEADPYRAGEAFWLNEAKEER